MINLVLAAAAEGSALNEVVYELAYMAAVWAIAFCAGVARLAFNRDLNGLWYCVGVGATAGFMAIAAASLWDLGSVFSNTKAPFGVAALIGVIGKEGLLVLITCLQRWLPEKLRIKDENNPLL